MDFLMEIKLNLHWNVKIKLHLITTQPKLDISSPDLFPYPDWKPSIKILIP